MLIDLKNKNAIVCGSTQGIGKASALALAAAGASVTLVARNQQRLEVVLSELDSDDGQQHGFVVADFQNPAELAEKVSAKVSQVGPFHILVNNTGGPPGGEIFGATIDAFESAFTQHLKCNHLLAQALVPGMKTAGYGRIINVISTSVKQPLDGLGVSNTIRGAVASWAKTMANELGQFGITVNNVLPGATATERLSSIIQSKAEKSGKSIEAVSEAMKSSVPAKRFADPSEIGNAVLFLASELASYVNGVNLPVDGGRTKCL
jgi:3-oxoacyl-[acyl-carrier protein] reductase